MDVNDVVKAWLEHHGYDGLFNATGDCSCLNDDLCPCGSSFIHCEPGYSVTCTPDCDHGYPFEDGNWHIQAENPNERKDR